MSGYTQIQPDSIEPDSPQLAQPNETTSGSIQEPQTTTSKPAGSGGLRQVSFYSRFFDISTEEFLGKIVLAMNPFNNASVVLTQAEDGPTELYGFLWINATVVVLMFVSATGSNLLAEWLHASKDTEKYNYNFQLLTLSISVFYGYTALVPTALYVITRWALTFPHCLPLTRLVSIYSYANVLWIPTTAANMILAVFISKSTHHVILNVAQWALVAASALLSGLSIALKVRPILIHGISESGRAEENTVQNQHRFLLISLVLAHLAFAVVIKFLFFGIA
ncbi:Yip1-domain-containing protein [Metschnikowia bicuspidata var. bicuspidata NRRL YB-4993]|uniref:Yip1-domain-containing protein n=1 Tax=Metschnikowia bicuspidata var. bicuspidata NRRL YB-4993 TaxID=869754 RepID=A0A1A0HGP2_9ASCO|nr:Yip1-domain-containing protein [Metschnikowia bicuspidata var. bicuspidata NRRL YB-4993]OBA23047.1 Yip1-domain-containing protein [Metschnikowia bicuspidata var. bicuspidata NRRL YB-4993]